MKEIDYTVFFNKNKKKVHYNEFSRQLCRRLLVSYGEYILPLILKKAITAESFTPDNTGLSESGKQVVDRILSCRNNQVELVRYLFELNNVKLDIESIVNRCYFIKEFVNGIENLSVSKSGEDIAILFQPEDNEIFAPFEQCVNSNCIVIVVRDWTENAVTIANQNDIAIESCIGKTVASIDVLSSCVLIRFDDGSEAELVTLNND